MSICAAFQKTFIPSPLETLSLVRLGSSIGNGHGQQARSAGEDLARTERAMRGRGASKQPGSKLGLSRKQKQEAKAGVCVYTVSMRHACG